MIYTPNRTELATIAQRLDLPTIPPNDFLSALIDAYADFCDVEYEDILTDIDAGYLTYHETKPVDADVTCADSDAGYLWYYDGGVEVLVPVNEVPTINIKATIKDELKGKLESTLALLKQEKVDKESIKLAIKNIQLAINMID